MDDFGWQIGMLLVLFFAVVVPWLVANVISFGGGEEWDSTADFKRRVTNRGLKTRAGIDSQERTR